MDTASTGGVDNEQLDALCGLDDPTRRRLYDYVAAQGQAITRDQASHELGMERSTVAYHLDRLVDDGLLTATFARPPGRGGPGAGRPAKHYQRAETEFAVSVPPRDYRLAAELLARAAAADATGTVRQALQHAAEQLGTELATADTPSTSLLELLAQQGFEPYNDGGIIRLRNCPFHQLAQEHTELICGMNLAMLTGATHTIDTDHQPRLDPGEDRCCVAFYPPS